MKSLYLFGLLVLFHCSFVYGQYEKSNLEKYWRYKARFEKDFIILPSDANSAIDKAGVSVPALTWKLTTDNKKNILDFTDGNANFSHYLGVLSTEYRLLKNGGYNYDETIKRLYYAFKAIDRIDQNSESFFRTDGSVQTADKNGWMIRDDVTPQFWSNNCSKLGLPNTGVNHFVSGYAGFNNSQDGHTKESVSQDNIFHLLEGLALVNKLCGVEYVDVAKTTIDFPAWAKDITTRVIKMMQHATKIYLIAKSKDDRFDCYFSPPTWWQWALSPDWAVLQETTYLACCNGFNSQWYIQNPANGELAYEGSGKDFDLWGFYSYGLVRAGNKITNTSFDYDKSSDDLQQQLYTSWFNGEFTGTISTIEEAVETTIVEAVSQFIVINLTGLPSPLPAGVKNDVVKKIANSITGEDIIQGSTVEKDPYKVKTLATVGNIFGENTFWSLRSTERERYGHFMLMYVLLHGSPTNYSSASIQYQDDKNYFKTLLSLAPCKGPRNFRVAPDDDFNQEWSASSRLVWPENRGLFDPATNTDPTKTKKEHNGLDYMLLHNLYCLVYQSDFRKLTVEQAEDLINKNKTETAVDIIVDNTISGTTVLNDVAYNSIRLTPGFHGIAGATFDGKIISSAINYTGFSQNNPCSYTYSGRLSNTVLPESPIAIPYKNEESELKIVPNPNQGVFQIVLNPNENINGKIFVKDLTGKDIYSREIRENISEIDIRHCSKGVYLILVQTGNKIYKQKLVIE